MQLFIMVGDRSHEPPRDTLSEAIGPELGHSTPEPVTAEGSRIPCAIPGVPQLSPGRTLGLTGSTVEGGMPVGQTSINVCQNVHLRVKNRFQKVMIHFVLTQTEQHSQGSLWQQVVVGASPRPIHVRASAQVSCTQWESLLVGKMGPPESHWLGLPISAKHPQKTFVGFFFLKLRQLLNLFLLTSLKVLELMYYTLKFKEALTCIWLNNEGQ